MICAAILHAGRNAALRGGSDRLRSMTPMMVAVAVAVDGIGVRLSGDSLADATRMVLPWSLTRPPIDGAMRGRPPVCTGAQTAMALTGGLVSMLAYGLVVRAMRHAAMGAASAQRETGRVFAAVVGRIVLKETLTARRIASCVAIAAIAAGAAGLAV